MKITQTITKFITDKFTRAPRQVTRTYPNNSNAVKKFSAKQRERVVHSGGTRVGSFKDYPQ